MKSVIRPAARQDIERQFRYYLVEQDVPKIGLRFLDAIQAALDAIRRNPAIGSPRYIPDVPGLRSWPVPGFEDIRIYYIETPRLVRVIRVLHGRRDLRRIISKEKPI